MARSVRAEHARYANIGGDGGVAERVAALSAHALDSHRAGQLGEAIGGYDRILALQPFAAEIHNNRGLALADLGRHEEAAESFRRSAELKPGNPQTLCNWGVTLAQLERGAEAEAKFRQAVAASPGFAGAYNNLGLVLKEQGRMAEAVQATEAAIRLAPREPAYYDNLAAIKPLAAGDPHLAALETLAADAASLSPTHRMHLHFALAKACEHGGRWQDAFQNLLAANALKRRQVAYDEAATLAHMQRIRACLSRDFIAQREGSGDPSGVPIFIVGMPRSGTTLIEQILASHPQVAGGGELGLFEAALDATRQALPGSLAFPDAAAAMSPRHFRDLGAGYAAKLAQRAAGAMRVTDKMPTNFLQAGLIHLALPNAVILHAVRDPIDTCVSCFSVHFSRGQAHTYDLAELGRYYRHYRSLMNHWRHALPSGRILDIRYEELVADPERMTRRIVAACGLHWDARCLAFYQSERLVRTASAAQVRRPIYRGAVGRGRRYENFLAPLLAELAPATEHSQSL